MTKTSIPKLHSFKLKDGITRDEIVIHPNKYDDVEILAEAIKLAINNCGANLPRASIVGTLEFIKRDFLL